MIYKYIVILYKRCIDELFLHHFVPYNVICEFFIKCYCISITGSFRCMCKSGFSGANCEVSESTPNCQVPGCNMKADDNICDVSYI